MACVRCNSSGRVTRIQGIFIPLRADGSGLVRLAGECREASTGWRSSRPIPALAVWEITTLGRTVRAPATSCPFCQKAVTVRGDASSSIGPSITVWASAGITSAEHPAPIANPRSLAAFRARLASHGRRSLSEATLPDLPGAASQPFHPCRPWDSAGAWVTLHDTLALSSLNGNYFF